MTTDPRVDSYIAAQSPFAVPILHRVRALVHETAPDAAETIKWGRPFFTIGGRPFCFLAAFKAHAAFGFWQDLAPTGREGEAAGSLGRLTSLDDLPPEADLRTMIADAAGRAALARPARPKPAPRALLPMPDDLARALGAEPIAAAHFAALAPGHRREYLEWIGQAKRPETRARRIAGTIEKLTARETLNARYAGR